MKKIQLHWQILIALFLGVLYGLFFPGFIDYVSWMGDIFLRALRMVIVPLILSSIISGVANIGTAENLGRLGMKTMGYYVITSTIAILTGLFFVNLFQPGVGTDLGLVQEVEGLGVARESFGQTLLNIVPLNIFDAFSSGKMLSIIFFAIMFGYFITRSGRSSRKTMTDFFNAVFEVMMKITMFIIRFTPFGVFGIMALQVSKSPDIIGLAKNMGIYMITVLLALAVHFVISLPLLTKFVGKVNPLKHFKAVTTPLLTAFSTSSSSATLPLTMQAVEENDGVSNKITSFTLPLGATINMDGTALYECVAAIFIAQAYGVELSFFQQVLVVITALFASIGAAGIPMAGLVMISVILTAVGLPLEGVGLILAVDRILDMFRTATNVWSDSCGAVIIAKSEGEKLKVDNEKGRFGFLKFK
jgi:Na+/H+-dicarboxylate symporter